ncbi:DUF1987 domain-containing protein [Flavobacteriales bacterium]|jgi:hypothetical protein|nr:DUF1987 domain-containing protein [Flavobacteriales bacterium]
MNDLILEATDTAPKIHFQSNGNLIMDGESRPENVVKFFEPLMNWMDELKSHEPDHITLDFKLEYYNSSSAKFIMELLLKLNNFKNVLVKWHYDEMDEDLLESGEEFEKLVNYSFEFIAIEDED